MWKIIIYSTVLFVYVIIKLQLTSFGAVWVRLDNLYGVYVTGIAKLSYSKVKTVKRRNITG